MSYADRISKARRNYSGIVPKTEADGVLAKFIQRITDGIQQTAEDELTAREYTNTGAKLKHPASQATLDKLKAEIIGPVNMSGGEDLSTFREIDYDAEITKAMQSGAMTDKEVIATVMHNTHGKADPTKLMGKLVGVPKYVHKPPRTQLDRIEDKLNEILKLLKKE